MRMSFGIARFITSVVGVAFVVGAAGWSFRTRLRPEIRTATSCEGEGWVPGGTECLRFERYTSAELTAHPRLVIVLHGDSPTRNPSYQYDWAREAARQNADVLAIGLLRPGYTDRSGHQSSGVRGKTTGDNYTPAVINAVAQAIGQLKQRYRPSRTVIAGHSGGAAIAAGLMGRHPGVADRAVLVSCPCDVPRWREHMRAASQSAIWSEPVDAVSPISLVSAVDRNTRLAILVGQSDRVTPPWLSREYYDLLRKRAIDVQFSEIPGGHEIFFDGAVRRALADLLNE